MKKLLLTLAAVLVLGGGTGVIIANQNDPKPVAIEQHVEHKQEGIAYKGVEGKTALELLKSNYKVETESFSGVGEMVKSIDGVTPDSKHFWGFHINDQMAQVGADSYETKSSDNIEWKLVEIQ